MFGLSSEAALRLALFLGVLAVMALWETLAPRRRRDIPRTQRWPANFGIAALDTALLFLVLPAGAAAFALWVQNSGWGLLNVVDVPLWLAAGLSVALLDLVIYAQHVLLHKSPLLWRIHRMHHTDLELDVSSGVRFHPLEILFSMAVKLAVIALLGAPPEAVLLFEIVLNATSMFNHANINLPPAVDRLLRRIMVTPDMHRVHHSVRRAETDSNYGFNLSCWDRLFRTYTAQPGAGHLAMKLGLSEFPSPEELKLKSLLTQPFRRK